MKLVQLVLVVGAVAVLSACGAAETVSTGERPVTTPAEPGSQPPTTGPPESGPEAPATRLNEPISESETTFSTQAQSFDEVYPESPCDTDPTLTCELPDGAVFDDRWVATVTLECGSQPSKRRIAAFDAETAGYGDPVLSTGARQSNGGILTTGTRIVGDEVDADGLLMFWNIHKVLIGPWDLDTITDTCNDPNADPITEATNAPPPETTEQP